MKKSFKVALLLDDKVSKNLLKSIFTLTEKRNPSYVREENISDFGYLGVDICVVDPSSLTSLKLYLKILKYHNRVKALFLLGPDLPQSTVKDKLNALKYQEKYGNLIDIFKKEIDAIPLVTHPFSWNKVVSALDKIGETINMESSAVALSLNSTHDSSSMVDTTNSISGYEKYNSSPYEDPRAFKKVKKVSDSQNSDASVSTAPSHLSTITAGTFNLTSTTSSGDTSSAQTAKNNPASSQTSNPSYLSHAPESPLSTHMSDELDIRAMVIDESSESRRFVAEKLKAQSDKVDFATDGQEALIMMSQKSYDVIFLDTDTISYDGYHVCKLLRAQSQKQGIQCLIVVMTSHTGFLDKFKINRSGCDEYLKKPMQESELLAVLNKIKRLRQG